MVDSPNPRVSVVIPTYNMQELIGETLASVRSQTFGDFEVVVVDDCSTDRTAEVVHEYVAIDSRFRYVRLERNSNRPAVPRNRGIRESRGEFISFLDHDDTWLPWKLERQLAVLDACPDVALVHSYLWDFTPRSRVRGLIYLPNPYRRRGTHDVLLEHNVVQCSSAMVRAEVLHSVGVFDERIELRTVEDYHLWTRIARNHRLAYLSEVQGHYRWSPLSASGQENWLEKHAFLDSSEGFKVLDSRPNRAWQVTRKVAGFPLAVYFHLVEAPLRRRIGLLPRSW